MNGKSLRTSKTVKSCSGQGKSWKPLRLTLGCVLLLFIWAGCSSSHYQKTADKEVYKILAQKEAQIFGTTNAFTIDTKYSATDPNEIKAQHIISERLEEGDQLITIRGALDMAVANSREYQLNKENLYLSALSLTGERYAFTPQFFAGSTGAANRDTSADISATANSKVGMDWFLRTGGSLSVALANDITKYFTGGTSREATSVITLDITQPLLRGAGAKVAAENLTQAERNVIYSLRSYTQYQRTFAFGIVSAYYRILREKDTVRNQYNNYLRLKDSSERSAMLAQDNRLPPSQADQARQSELQAKRAYESAVKSYQDLVNSFKLTLGVPISQELKFADKALDDIREVGLIPLSFDVVTGYKVAVTNQLEVLNDIDTFEDAKRKITVAASALKTGLNFFANTSLTSDGRDDYTKFNIDNYKISSGLQLDLPIDRLLKRNDYRKTLVNFERAIRNLALSLDSLHGDIDEGLRQLNLLRRNYETQKIEMTLANRRVEREELLLKAGRSQIRDLLEAQDARVRSQNGLTQTLVDYHVARLSLLLRIGVLDTNVEDFWLARHPLPGETTPPAPLANAPATNTDDLITPEQLFGK